MEPASGFTRKIKGKIVWQIFWGIGQTLSRGFRVLRNC
jgi:hypothetical protein